MNKFEKFFNLCIRHDYFKRFYHYHYRNTSIYCTHRWMMKLKQCREMNYYNSTIHNVSKMWCRSMATNSLFFFMHCFCSFSHCSFSFSFAHKFVHWMCMFPSLSSLTFSLWLSRWARIKDINLMNIDEELFFSHAWLRSHFWYYIYTYIETG